VIIPDFPQLEAEVFNTAQRLPITEQLLCCLGFPFEVTRVEFDHQLLDVEETLWIFKHGVDTGPLRALNVNLQNVNCRLQ